MPGGLELEEAAIVPGLPTLHRETSTSSSLPFQLGAGMLGKASPVPNLKGPGPHESSAGAATLLRPWGSAVSGTKDLGVRGASCREGEVSDPKVGGPLSMPGQP